MKTKYIHRFINVLCKRKELLTQCKMSILINMTNMSSYKKTAVISTTHSIRNLPLVQCIQGGRKNISKYHGDTIISIISDIV